MGAGRSPQQLGLMLRHPAVRLLTLLLLLHIALPSGQRRHRQLSKGDPARPSSYRSHSGSNTTTGRGWSANRFPHKTFRPRRERSPQGGLSKTRDPRGMSGLTTFNKVR